MSDYEQQALDFAEKHGVTLTVTFSHYGLYFPDDKEKRDVYNCFLQRKGKGYSFTFGQSIAHSTGSKKWVGQGIKRKEVSNKKVPTMYDILACLQKYDPDTFDNFCSEFGYDTDSRKALDTYLSVQEEWKGVRSLFHDILEELQEIN